MIAPTAKDYITIDGSYATANNKLYDELAEYVLMDTSWNQSSTESGEYSFNKYCPYIKEVGQLTKIHSYTGCVSTMAGQIVYYWMQKKGFELDLSLTADDSYITSWNIVVNTSQHNTYGYLSFSQVNNLLANFTIGVDHNNHNDGIAALCFALGVKAEADYGDPTGTSTTMLIADVFKSAGFVSAGEINHEHHQYFYTYDENTNAAPQLTTAGWEIIADQLKNELVMGCMIYKGEATQHAIAIDGYSEEENMIHLNFGWGDYEKIYDPVSGRYEGNGWYTRKEFEALRPAYFLADLRGDYSGKAFKVSSEKVYGVGTLNRVIEQVNALTFAGSMTFESIGDIRYSESAFDITNSVTIQDFRSKAVVEVKDGSGYLFHNSNGDRTLTFTGKLSCDITVKASEEAAAVSAGSITVDSEWQGAVVSASTGSGTAYGFQAMEDILFHKLTGNGNVVVSSEDNDAYAFAAGETLSGTFSGGVIANSKYSAYAFSGDEINISINGGVVFAGSYLGSSSNYQVAANLLYSQLAARANTGSKVEDSFIEQASGYVVYGDYADDIVSISGKSLVLGDIVLSGGENQLTLSSESRIYGDISGYNIDLTFDLVSTSDYAIINSNNIYSLVHDTEYTVALDRAVDGSYILIDSMSSLNGFKDIDFVVEFNNVVYTVDLSHTFQTYDFIDFRVDGSRLVADLANVTDGSGGLHIQPSTTKLTNQDVVLTIEMSKNYTDLFYSLDGGGFVRYTDAGIVVKQNGEIKFQMVALDGTRGNASYFVNNIDKEPPAAPSITPSTTEVTREDVVLTVVFAEDAVIKEFSRDGINWRKCISDTVTVNENSTVYFRCFDAAGNMSQNEYTVFNIDGIGPNKPEISYSEEGPTRNNVIVSAHFDAYSHSNSYSFDGKLWRPYKEPLEMSENGVIYFRSIDEYGDIATVKGEVTNIDRNPPTAPVVVQQVRQFDGDTMVVVSAEFAADSVLNEVSMDGGKSYTVYTAAIECYENVSMLFRSTDAAGNVSAVTPCVVKCLASAGRQNGGFFVDDFSGSGSAMLGVVEQGVLDIYQDKEQFAAVDLGKGWKLCGTGDFDGDGKADLLRKYVDGLVMVDFSSGDGNFTSQVVNNLEFGWKMDFTGDFNGDGADDVLLSNPTAASADVGLIGYWSKGSEWNLINGYSPEWDLVGVGDFDGDGIDDMLWKNEFTGSDGKHCNAYCSWIVGSDNHWRMVSVADPADWNYLCSGDFDGDNVSDIAMINKDGVVGIWGVKDGAMADWTLLSAVDRTQWQLAGVGDFNGDGSDDIAWCNSANSEAGYWQIENKEWQDWKIIISAN